MSVYRQPNQAWRAKFQHRTENGETQWIIKHGFATKRDALQWEETLRLREHNTSMTFRDFVQQIYFADKSPHFREKTFVAKRAITEKMLLPYLGKKRLCDITAADVLAWKDEITGQGDVKAAYKQLNEIFDHAVRFYGLTRNPARSAGSMPLERERKKKPRTREEYQTFVENIADEQLAHYSLEILSWSGIRVGELLALTPADIDLERRIITVSKTLQNADDGDIAAEPRPIKPKRKVRVPDFLCDEILNCMKMQPELKHDDRLFPVTLLQNTLAAI